MPIDRQPNSPTKFMRMGLCPKCGENSYNTSMDGRLFIHSNTAPHCCCEECYEQADRADLDDDNPDGLFLMKPGKPISVRTVREKVLDIRSFYHKAHGRRHNTRGIL
jgi:hypothetical protein